MTQHEELNAVARAIIDSNLYMVLGTADEAGCPWVTPVYYASANSKEFYWVSSLEAQHSRNIALRPQMLEYRDEAKSPIDDLLERLATSDTLIVTEMSRLGRSTAEVISLVNQLIARSIRVIVIKQNLDLNRPDMGSKIMVTVFSLLGYQRDLFVQYS